MNFVACRGVQCLIGALLMLLYCPLLGQRQIAITIDDPTTTETPLLTWQARDSLMLSALDKHGIKAALFVCGKRVDHVEGRKLLHGWDARDHVIGNHSYSHMFFHSPRVTSSEFIEDFVKGDSIIRSYRNYRRLFRFPYLKEGHTAQKRDSMRAALRNANYSNGHVTVDASDWFIDAQMQAEIKENANADLSPYKDFYLKHILDRAHYYDSLAHLVFDKGIPHTLLLHHSLLNALFLDDLLNALRSQGWELIDAQQAYKEPLYSMEPSILPCGESLVWQSARLVDSISASLRYPAENGTYESEPLQKHIREYRAEGR